MESFKIIKEVLEIYGELGKTVVNLITKVNWKHPSVKIMCLIYMYVIWEVQVRCNSSLMSGSFRRRQTLVLSWSSEKGYIEVDIVREFTWWVSNQVIHVILVSRTTHGPWYGCKMIKEVVCKKIKKRHVFASILWKLVSKLYTQTILYIAHYQLKSTIKLTWFPTGLSTFP